MEKNFFSQFIGLIEDYVRPGKYWLVCGGLLTNHLYNSNFIFLSNALMVEAE
jgi:hypothetical protein